MTPSERAAAAFDRMAWTDVVGELETLDDGALFAVDLERLATARYLTGRDADAVSAWDRAHRAHLDAGAADDAARCAVWLALTLILRGDMAQGGVWLGRAGALVEHGDAVGSGRGYVAFPSAFGALEAGDHDAAIELATRAEAVGRTTRQPDVVAMAQLIRGQARIAAGETVAGLNDFDQAMVSVTGGEISPIPAGIIYCAVIAHCVAASDVRRAAEWTDALAGWCDRQQDLVPYRGQCLVHRSQVLQMRGSWPEAAAEARAATQRLTDPPHPALGLAHYQRGELCRLRGQVDEAEQAFRAASLHGYDPMPGLAELRAMEGKLDTAVASLRRALAEPIQRDRSRARLLAAAVGVFLEASDVDAAAACASELAERARALPIPVLIGLADQARSAVLLERGDAIGAIEAARAAVLRWRELDMPYEHARGRVVIGRALLAMGDDDGAELELGSARSELERLGAASDLAALAAAETPRSPGAPGGLTDRETEVLRLVAAGNTNRDVGDQLFISEHTVARHLQNIFTKVGVSSRAAATAWAYEHGLI